MVSNIESAVARLQGNHSLRKPTTGGDFINPDSLLENKNLASAKSRPRKAKSSKACVVVMLRAILLITKRELGEFVFDFKGM